MKRAAGLQRGQAMAEFVVMTAGCLLMLFVLVPVVAKLSDMSYKAQETARYTAWERTVWYNSNASSDSLPSQIDTRDGHLASRSDAAILNSAEQRLLGYTSEPPAFAAQDIAPTSEGGRNRFWRWTHGSRDEMLEAGSMPGASQMSVGRTPSAAYSVIDTYNDAMGPIVKVVSIFTSFGAGGDEDFLQIAHPTRNFHMAEVELPVPLAGSELGSQKLFGENTPTALQVRARSAVLADGWVAQSEGHFDEKANDFVIGTLIENNPVWGIVRSVIGIFEPSFKHIDFSPVNTDPMPDGDVDCNVTTGFCYFK